MLLLRYIERVAGDILIMPIADLCSAYVLLFSLNIVFLQSCCLLGDGVVPVIVQETF